MPYAARTTKSTNPKGAKQCYLAPQASCCQPHLKEDHAGGSIVGQACATRDCHYLQQMDGGLQLASLSAPIARLFGMAWSTEDSQQGLKGTEHPFMGPTAKIMVLDSGQQSA